MINKIKNLIILTRIKAEKQQKYHTISNLFANFHS